MNNLRRSLMVVGVYLLTLTGCMTAKLYETTPGVRTEVVSSVLISSDEKYLVILSDNSHYLFEAPPDIVRLLRSDLRHKVEAHIGDLTVDKYGNAEVSFGIYQQGVLTPEEELTTEMLFGKRSLMLSGRMKGKHYDSGRNAVRGHEEVELSKTYTIRVYYEESIHPVSARALATPITLAADGITLVLAAPLAPIALMPILFFTFYGSPMVR